MDAGRQFIALLIFCHCYPEILGAMTVRVSPDYAVVNAGEDVTFKCNVMKDGEMASEKLGVCIFTIGGKRYFFRKGAASGNIREVGAQDQGECAVRISSVEENQNGNITCSVALGNEVETVDGRMSLVVAIAPQKPKLEVLAPDSKSVYSEGEVLMATCIVRDGRPVANISWYLDSEFITEGVKMPLETCTLEMKGLCTIQQNLTRTLQASDDKKVLRCFARHQGYRGNDQSVNYTIHVNYSPKPASHPLEFFSLVEGALGRIPLTIEANPKPQITWFVDGETILEGTSNGRYTVEPTSLKVPGVYESALVIDTLTKEDTDKRYKVNARNEAGETVYSLSISTSPGPKVLEMGAGLMIVIVVVILLVILIMTGIWYTRAKGKFCFSGRKAARIPGESSDTESADHSCDPKPKITFVSVFKKRDKVAVDEDVSKNEQPTETVDNCDSVVYAELDLAKGPSVVVRGDDDKTEYAEIIHTK